MADHFKQYNIPYHSHDAGTRETGHAHPASYGTDVSLDHDYESIDLAERSVGEDERSTATASRNYYNIGELVQQTHPGNNEDGGGGEEEVLQLDVYSDSAPAGSRMSLDHDYESIDLNDVRLPELESPSLEHSDYVQFIVNTGVRRVEASEKTLEKKTTENNADDDDDDNNVDDGHVYVSIASSESDTSGQNEDGNRESGIHRTTSEHDYLSLRGNSVIDMPDNNPAFILRPVNRFDTGPIKEPNYVNMFRKEPTRVDMASDSYEHVYARAEHRGRDEMEHRDNMEAYTKIEKDLPNDYESITDIHSRQQAPVKLPERKGVASMALRSHKIADFILGGFIILTAIATTVLYSLFHGTLEDNIVSESIFNTSSGLVYDRELRVVRPPFAFWWIAIPLFLPGINAFVSAFKTKRLMIGFYIAFSFMAIFLSAIFFIIAVTYVIDIRVIALSECKQQEDECHCRRNKDSSYQFVRLKLCDSAISLSSLGIAGSACLVLGWILCASGALHGCILCSTLERRHSDKVIKYTNEREPTVSTIETSTHEASERDRHKQPAVNIGVGNGTYKKYPGEDNFGFIVT